jgi:uncharacterized membrane protein
MQQKPEPNVGNRRFNIIGGDGKEYGPYTVGELQEFMNQGRLNRASQVKEDDLLGEWQPLSEVLGRGTSQSIEDLENALLASEYRVDMGTAFGEAWTAFKGNFGMVLAGVFVYFAVLIGVSMVPLVGGIVQFVIQGAMTGGLFIFILKILRHETAEINDLFEGFKTQFGSLFLVNLLIGLITFACILPGLILFLVGFIPPMADIDPDDSDAFVETLIAAVFNPLTIGGVVLMVVLSSIVSVLIYWALPLVADREFRVMESLALSIKIAKRNFLNLLLIYFVGIFIVGLSAIPFGLGLLITYPLMFTVAANCYEQMFSMEYNE